MILMRMVRVVDWSQQTLETGINALSIWIDLLSTRVQLGQTTTEIASELVAHSFANVCGYFPGSRAILLGYSPDPVCARLAMCMMDDTFKVHFQSQGKTKTIKGEDHKVWAAKLKTIFSSGLINPDKGNFGEVVVALYMLFCGDLLRKKVNKEHRGTLTQDYSQFSVSLEDWLQLMMSGGKFPSEIKKKVADCKISVGFIQVCRNSLKSYSYSWEHLTDQCFLKHIYESGIAFSTCHRCPLIDMVVPLRIQTQIKTKKRHGGGTSTEVTFVPMLVSINCHESFSEGDADKECQKLKARATKDGLSRALCLLIVFGSSQNTPLKSVTPRKKGELFEDVYDVLTKGNKVIAKTIRVPLDDEFGLSALFNDMTPPGQMDAELLSAHPFLKGHGRSPDPIPNETKDDVLNAS